MAGDWIKMRGNLWDDPRVSRLVDITDSSEAAIVGALYWLWATADQHTEDGVMHGLTLRGIDRKTGVAGLGDALCAIKWLADHPEGVRILNFEDHNGASAKSRIQTAKRVAIHKANGKVTEPALPEQHDGVTDALPREEKRREETNTAPTGACPDEPDAAKAAKEKKEKKAKPELPNCPYGELLKLWRKCLPSLVQPRVWEGSRRVTMRERWQQASKSSAYSPAGYASEEAGIAWWESFFTYIANDTRLPAGFGSDSNWRPDLEWVCNAANFQKIIDGKYNK